MGSFPPRSLNLHYDFPSLFFGDFFSGVYGCYLFLGSLLSKRIFVRRKAGAYLVLVKITLQGNWLTQFVAHGKSYQGLFQNVQLLFLTKKPNLFWIQLYDLLSFANMRKLPLFLWWKRGPKISETVLSVDDDILYALSPSETFRKQPAEWFQFSEDYASLRGVFPCLRKL